MIQLINLRSSELTDRLVVRLATDWKQLCDRPEAGFAKIPDREEDWKAIEERLDDLRSVQRVIVIGIGGSSLGTQVIYECFRSASSAEFLFLESPSPHIWTQLRNLGPDWLDCHVVIVSKSGQTLETLIWMERLAAQEPSWLNPKNCTVICSPGQGLLQQWAERHKVATLSIPADVGGRFSVLTAAGMFPAGLMGLTLHEFRDGANWALERPELAHQLSAEILRSWQENAWITQMWTYSEGLKWFGDWWQQLWGESLAKKTQRDGRPAPRVSTPMPCRGPRDQHSVVQQLMEGERDKFVFVTRIQGVEAADEKFQPKLFKEAQFAGKMVSLGSILGVEAEAFEKSLNEIQLPYVSFRVDYLSERSLGAMFMLWQMVVAQLGEHIGINPFDQPGVELGKKQAAAILRHLSPFGNPPHHS